MISSAHSTAPLFGRAQRRYHLLLLLFLSAPALTLEKLCQLNGVDPVVARQDIADVGDKIQRFHQLELHQMVDGSFRIHGTELDRRLCLLHWRRLSQDFVCTHFAPALRQRLKVLKIEKALCDETHLQALIQHRNLRLAAKIERGAADDVIHHWQKCCHLAPDVSETDFWTLLFSLIHAPDCSQLADSQAQKLMAAVEALIARFEQLAQALDRSHFAIGIDNSVALDVVRLYPRLLRTTARAAALQQRFWHVV